MKRTGIWVGLLLLVIIGFFAWKGPLSKAPSVVKIGAAICLTGFGADWGEAELHAAQLAVKEANAKGGIGGTPIELVVEDTTCDSKTTVTVTTKLVDVDHVVGIIGPTWGDAFTGIYPILNAKKIVSISPSMAMESLRYNHTKTDYVFSTWFPQSGEVDTLQSYIETTGKKHIVVLHDEDLFASAMSEFFITNAAAHGISIEKSYTFPIGFEDFRTTIVELKNLHPDGIFAVMQNPATKAKFYKQARELGLNVTFFSLTDVQDEDLLKNFGPVLEGVIYTHPKISAREAEFEQTYHAATNNASLGLSAANAYDATNILIAALQKTGGSREGLRDALLQVHTPGVVVDDISFNEQHQIKGLEFNIKTIKNGQFTVIQ